uniref:Uncharacterized protein n=1 Tax=Anguilla anguilla TaxID=7936 RepID=A0A0E9X3I0_ANGAN
MNISPAGEAVHCCSPSLPGFFLNFPHSSGVQPSVHILASRAPPPDITLCCILCNYGNLDL